MKIYDITKILLVICITLTIVFVIDGKKNNYYRDYVQENGIIRNKNAKLCKQYCENKNFIKYKYKNKTYKHNLDTNIIENEGKGIILYLNKNNPEEIITQRDLLFNFGYFLFLLFLWIMLIMSIIYIIYNRRKYYSLKSKNKKLNFIKNLWKYYILISVNLLVVYLSVVLLIQDYSIYLILFAIVSIFSFICSIVLAFLKNIR